MAKDYPMDYAGNADYIHSCFARSCNLEPSDALRMFRRGNSSDSLANVHKEHCPDGNAVVCLFPIMGSH